MFLSGYDVWIIIIRIDKFCIGEKNQGITGGFFEEAYQSYCGSEGAAG